ncbi:MAG TPA: heparin lyase I family protein [Vicinamibacteria bacterium]|nr:heparin lyase I family protein [Vicinamibacteria bacterium]
MTKRLLIVAALVAAPMWAEAQTCGAWSVCSASADLAVTSGAAFPPSSYGLAITVNDASEVILVRDNNPANEASYWGRFYFNPNNEALVIGNRQRIFMIQDSSNTRLAVVVFRKVAGGLSLLARVWNGTTTTDNAAGIITNAWHYVTLHWVKATTPSGTDGIFQLYVDGTQMVNLTNLATGGSPGVDYARMGVLDPLQYNGTAYTLYFDEVEERRQTNPGAYVP